MKKKLLLGIVCCMFTILQLQAQEHEHEHDSPNPNITPYHEAADALAGINGLKWNESQPWQNFLKKHDQWGAKFDYYTGMPRTAFGNPLTVPGNSIEEQAFNFMKNELGELEIPVGELVRYTQYEDKKFKHIHFHQVHQGYKVAFSKVSFRFSKENKLFWFSVHAHKNIGSISAPLLSEQQAKFYAEQALVTQIVQSEVKGLEILPVPQGDHHEFKLCYVVDVKTMDTEVMDGYYHCYIDANTGQVLYRQNKVVSINGKVKGMVYPKNKFTAPVEVPLADMRLSVGSNNYFTNQTGNVIIPSSSNNINATVHLEGKWVKVYKGATSTIVPSYSATIVNNDSLIFDTLLSATNINMVNIYDAVTVVHNYMKTKWPSFTAMDDQMIARVDRTDGTCNAFYNGTSVNFYAANNTCNATGTLRSVAFHEYGHGINYEYYGALGGNWENGAMGEGYSDAWSFNITKDPIVGQGFYANSPTSSIRRYDIAPKVYPDNIVGEVHADGEIIAGAWWDTYLNINDTTIATNLFAETYNALSSAPDGEEGSLYYQILIDALTYDDVDNNIVNGTPHITQILKGFARHGIYILGDAALSHTGDLNVKPQQNVDIKTTVSSSFPALVNRALMVYRPKQAVQLPLDTLVLTKNGTTMNYNKNFTGTTAGTLFEYYLGVTDIFNDAINATSPYRAQFTLSNTQRNIPYYLPVSFEPKLIQNFEGSMSGWTIGRPNDNATGGKWFVALPISSSINGKLVQTGNDHTTGAGKCAITGNAVSSTSSASSSDVDGGHTVILSPVYDLSSYNIPTVSYWRWFSNSQGNNPRKDVWRVHLSDNGGTTWTPIDRTYQPDVSWRRQVVKIKDVKPQINLANIQFAFIAVDSTVTGFSGGSLVEAALDDFAIMDLAGPESINNITLENNPVIYPNPTSGELILGFETQFTGRVAITDLTGKELIVNDLMNEREKAFDLTNFVSGIYLMRISNNEGQSQLIKFMKQ